MESPRFPWEVIERVIGHSGDYPRSLLNFSLTCRDLRQPASQAPRSLDSCKLRRLRTFPPPYYNILPNLSDLTLAPARSKVRLLPYSNKPRPQPVLNQIILTCCRHVGTRIQALRLSELSFPTYLEFARVLLAFTNLTHLVCRSVVIRAEGNRAHLDVIKRRLSERLHLLCYYDTPSVAALLLDWGLVQSTVETISVQKLYRSCRLSHLFGWPLLRTLVLKLEFTAKNITDAIVFLKEFLPSTLKDATVELQSKSIWAINNTLSGEAGSGRFEELEQTLLRFSQPRIVCLVDRLRHGKNSLWTQELGKRFPVLFQRGALSMASRTVTSKAGHDDAVWDLAPSPDGKWVATGSTDSTVILWDTTDGAIARQWAAHSYSVVRSLAFSPDGRYLVSGGWDSTVKLWDLAEGSAREVTTLKGHTNLVMRCAWSPRGDIIASASSDQTVRFWDARTFHQLRVLEHADGIGVNIQLIAFSPDGRWLVSGCSAFSLAGSTARLAIVPKRNMVKLVDVETGEDLAALRGLNETRDVAFSPDGTLVLTGSHDGAVKLWDAYTGVELFSLQGHKRDVSLVRFSPCGKYVASASDDGTVRLWRTRDGSCVTTFFEHQNSPVRRVAFSPDGETLWSGDSNGTVIMRRMRDIIPTDE